MKAGYQAPQEPIQFLIVDTTVTMFIRKFDHEDTVLFEKINSDTVIKNLVRPPPSEAAEFQN